MNNYCNECGNKLISDKAEYCTKCGVRLKQRTSKSKPVAIILAILVGIFAWIYTWKHDYWKFWVALGLDILLFWTLIVPIGLFVWVIIDTCLKSKEWYENY